MLAGLGLIGFMAHRRKVKQFVLKACSFKIHAKAGIFVCIRP